MMGRKRKLPEGMTQRGRHYYADFYAGGRRVRKRLATDLDAARDILLDMRSRAHKGDFGLLDNDFPLAELKGQWLRHCRQALKPKSVARYEANLGNILPRLAAGRVAGVLVAGVLAYREERLAEGASPRTVNMDVGALATMLRWGVRHRLIGSNPLADLAPLPHDRPKEGRPLTDDEVRRLLDTSPPRLGDIWYAFLVTGMRKEELAALEFRDIDGVSREIIVRGAVAKNHRERRIPIDAGLWEILERQEAGRAARQPGRGRTPAITERVQALFSRDHLFVSSQNTPLTHRSGLYHAFMRCCGRAGIPTQTADAEGRLVEHVDLHSLRRTFATGLIAGGADPKSVQELLGHRTLDMTMRIYAKVHTQTKRQALGKLPYGRGALAPEHVLPYPDRAERGETFPVQNGHQSVTRAATRTGGVT
jgi:integrase